MTASAKEIITILSNINPNRNFDDLDEGTLFADADIDSLDRMDLLLGVEERYGIKIPDEAVENLTSINAILAYLYGPGGGH